MAEENSHNAITDFMNGVSDAAPADTQKDTENTANEKSNESPDQGNVDESNEQGESTDDGKGGQEAEKDEQVDERLLKIEGGKYKSLEEFGKAFEDLKGKVPQYEKEITDLKARPERKYNHEIAEKFDEYMSVEGRKPEDFFKIVARDFSTLPPLKKIKEFYLLNNPTNRTEEQIDLILKSKFSPKALPVLDEDSTPDEIQRHAEIKEANDLREIEVADEANRADSYINEQKTKYKPTGAELKEKQQKESIDNQNKLIQEYSQHLSTYNDFEDEYVIEKGDPKNNIERKTAKIKYELTGEDKKALLDIYSGKRSLFEDYGNDINAYNRAVLKFINMEKREALIFQQGQTAGTEKLIRTRRNSDFKGDDKTKHDNKATSDIEDMRSMMA